MSFLLCLYIIFEEGRKRGGYGEKTALLLQMEVICFIISSRRGSASEGVAEAASRELGEAGRGNEAC